MKIKTVEAWYEAKVSDPRPNSYGSRTAGARYTATVDEGEDPAEVTGQLYELAKAEAGTQIRKFMGQVTEDIKLFLDHLPDAERAKVLAILKGDE